MAANQLAEICAAQEHPKEIRVKSLAAPRSDQKRLGAFYTPENLSRVLTDWAVQHPTDRVLEPSFGKCGFLAAAQRRLQELGCVTPKKQIFGCDVDAAAFKFLADTLGQPINANQFLQKDFLDVKAGEDWAHLFSCSIGNPPYIPFQALPESRRLELIQRCKDEGIRVSTRASLWAYFLLNATSFVAPGGRMAWVLPGAFLQADYAQSIRDYLSRAFDGMLCILMHQRFFKNEGTEEETVILLTRGRRPLGPPIDVLFAEARSVEELAERIRSWDNGETTGQLLNARPAYLSTSVAVLSHFKRLQDNPQCHTLGDSVLANIGLVTGANQFFVLSSEEKAKHRLRETDTMRVLGKFKAAKGLSFTISDHDSYMLTGARGHLIHSKILPREGSALRRYLDSFPEEERTKISTFKKRAIWHAPNDENIPDAFLPVMNHDGPRLVLNVARINCTNTLHRAFFRSPMTEQQKKLITISLLTSFSQLSAEFVGRRYGSGVLKHEPREIEKISVLLPELDNLDVDKYFDSIDKLLRDEQTEAAMKKADELVLGAFNDWEVLSDAFTTALEDARTHRRSTRYLTGA